MVRPRILASALLILALAPICPPAGADDRAHGDVIILHSGEQIWGYIQEQDQREVVIGRVVEGRYTQRRIGRDEIREIRRGQLPPEMELPVGDALREEWFLLQQDGRTIGTRHLRLASTEVERSPGFRLEETLLWFEQGRHMPRTSLHRVEETDLRFVPLRLQVREVVAGDRQRGRAVSANLADGRMRIHVGRGGAFEEPRTVPVPEGVRARLGLREHLLRAERKAGLERYDMIDIEAQRVVEVRAGWTGLDATRGEAGGEDELLWEEGDARWAAAFDRETRTLREEVGAGLVSIPVRAEQAAAARRQATGEPDAADEEILLPEPGLTFRRPDATWTWTPDTLGPRGGNWRKLGRLHHAATTADARFEWHTDGLPDQMSAAGGRPVEADDWLLQRLRRVCPDLRVVQGPQRIRRVPGAFRMALAGTLRDTEVHTVAVVHEQPTGVFVMLASCPAAGWQNGRAAIERLVDSLRALE